MLKSEQFVVRRAREDEYEALLEWLNGIFRPGVKRFFEREFCHLFRGPEVMSQSSWVVEEEGRFLAHIGVYPLEMVTSVGPLKAAGIGGVAVDEAARGRGLMRLLMERVLEEVVRDGYHVALLGGVRSIYQRFGFEVCGNYYQWLWDPQGKRAGGDWIKQVECAETASWATAWEEKGLGIRWGAEALAGLLQRPAWDRWVSPDRGRGLALVERTPDGPMLDAYFGGNDELPSLMGTLIAYYERPVMVRHCIGNTHLHCWMERLGMDIRRRGMGMMKVLDHDGLRRLSAAAGHPVGELPEDEGKAVRRWFGDPYDRYPALGLIGWEWEKVSHV